MLTLNSNRLNKPVSTGDYEAGVAKLTDACKLLPPAITHICVDRDGSVWGYDHPCFWDGAEWWPHRDAWQVSLREEVEGSVPSLGGMDFVLDR